MQRVERLIPSAWLVFLAACLWWLGVFAFDSISNQPHPRLIRLFMDWRQMDLIYRTAPWVVLPFTAFALWALAVRLRRLEHPPAWMTWACGMAALSWTGFVLWRAHDQSFKCAAWAQPEDFYVNADCWLPQILQSVVWWLVIPVAAWLVIAAASGSTSHERLNR